VGAPGDSDAVLRPVLTAAVLLLMLVICPSGLAAADAPRGAGGSDVTACRVYVGTYTTPSNGSKGIYLLDMDAKTGRLGEPTPAGEAKNPSFLAVDSKRRFLYAVGELSTFGGKKEGALSAFSIDPASGKLHLLNQHGSAVTARVMSRSTRRIDLPWWPTMAAAVSAPWPSSPTAGSAERCRFDCIRDRGPTRSVRPALTPTPSSRTRRGGTPSRRILASIR